MTISTKDFCHNYAYASNNESKRNGNMSYSNGVMLSYNTALAKKFDNFTLYNCTRYSNTTSKQQGYLRNALHGKVIYVDGLDYGTRLDAGDIISGLTHCLNRSVANLAKSKRTSTKERYTAEIFHHKQVLNELLEYKVLNKKDLSVELLALNFKNFDVSKVLELQKKAAKKEERARLQRLEKQRQDFIVEIADFKAGRKNNISYGARDLICGGFDIIRLEGEEILTSQNIRVPIKEALRLKNLAETAIKNKLGFQGKFLRTKKINGTFSIDRIDASGNCFVGCHKFKFEEIARCYKEEYKGGK